jgi:hypothetical protein
MYKSKLIEIIQVFDRKEKEALKKWVHSPIHHQHKKSGELILLLLSKRSLTPRTTNRHKIFEQLYPKQIYQDAKLKHLMNYCTDSMELFIEFLKQKENDFSNKKKLIEFFNDHKLEKHKQQSLLKLQKTQQDHSTQGRNYFHNQFELEKLIFESQNVTNRVQETNLQPLLDNHYISVILETLNYACEVLMHQRLYHSSYTIPLLNTIIEQLQEGQFSDIPAIQFYFHSYMCLKYPKEEYHFKVLQKLLVQQHNALPPKEIKSIYLMAINYCVRQLNSGAEKYVRSVFELYQYGLEHPILIENNYLNQFTHKNIITTAIRLEEYDWVKQFIQEYKSLLEEEYQESYTHYANAKLLFAQRKYDLCMQLLVQVEFDDLFLNMSAKSILLKIYYEQNSTDALMAFLVSFRRFLQRKTIVAYHREIYKNMILLTEKLLATPLNDRTKIAELREEIQQTNPLTEKPWLLKQLDLLSG